MTALESAAGSADPTRGAPSNPPKEEPRFTGHMPALDGVRGLAVLLVLLDHFIAGTTATNAIERAVTWAFAYGNVGVGLFFVLSGFLITGILFDSRDDPRYFQNFYMRRVLRIFPLYYAVVVAVVVLAPLVPAWRDSTHLAEIHEHQGWAWLYGVNVYIFLKGDWALSYIEHFWSLCVEEHFYFVWPMVVYFLARTPRTLIRVSLAVSVLALAARIAATAAGINPVPIYVFTPFRLDALCLGSLLAVWARLPGGARALTRAFRPMAAIAGGLLVASFLFNRFSDAGVTVLRPVRSSLFTVLAATLLLWALTAPRSAPVSRLFRSSPMIFLGKYSYGLYVYHHFISYYFTVHRTEFALTSWLRWHTAAVVVQATLGIAASMAIAWVSYEFFEKRFLSLKRLWTPAAAKAAQASGAAAAKPVHQ